MLSNILYELLIAMIYFFRLVNAARRRRSRPSQDCVHWLPELDRQCRGMCCCLLLFGYAFIQLAAGRTLNLYAGTVSDVDGGGNKSSSTRPLKALVNGNWVCVRVRKKIADTGVIMARFTHIDSTRSPRPRCVTQFAAMRTGESGSKV